LAAAVTFAATLVIPLLRQPDDWLDKSIRSAVEQSVNIEVVVVRSRCTPTSNLEVLKRIARDRSNLSVIMEYKAGSFPGAINTGIRHACTNRVGLLLADDWLEKDAIAQCLEHDADIVSSGNIVHFADERINAAASGMPSLSRFRSLATLQEKAAYLSHFFLFRRKTLLDAGGLDEDIGNYPGLDDYDLIWTLLERGATVSIAEKALYHYRDHEGERLTLTEPAKMVENLARILCKHGIGGDAARPIITQHMQWYGRPIYQVMNQRRQARNG
jgi:glycosyltransferase involved in cell wall biosynthesis